MAEESPGATHQPYQQPITAIAAGGINLNKPLNQLTPAECARLTNAVPRQGGGVDTRPGLTPLVQGAANYHSVLRFNDPQSGGFTRFWGADTQLFRGQSGVPNALAAGFSGNPLTMVSAQNQAASQSAVYVADSVNVLVKATITGPARAAGLPAPGAACATSILSILTTNICSFDTGDGTDAANWVATAGVDQSFPHLPALPAVLTDVPAQQGNGLGITTNPGQAVLAFNSIIGHVFTTPIDLTTLQGGSTAASDNDIIHFWMRVSDPTQLAEVRIYFVVSDGFDPTIVPGTSDTNVNGQAYWKSFASSDYTNAIGLVTTVANDAATLRAQDLINTYLTPAQRGVTGGKPSNADLPIGSNNTPDPTTVAAQGGAGVWTEFGAIGIPIRRGDFGRLGFEAGSVNAPATDWSHITGIIIVVTAQPAPIVGNSANPPLPQPITVSFDDLYLTGGYGPDTSEPGSVLYDYRYTHFLPLENVESNPSPIQATTAFLDALRQGINIVPPGSGTGFAGLVQRIYRRGGTLTDDWYFAGQNTADGALFTDLLDDASILDAGTLDIDNDLPVSSIDALGNTLLNQPIPIIFGPISGVLFGLGDKNRPGTLYWSKANNYDAWPAANNEVVCPPGEELMNGCVYGGQGFVFSRERGYSVQVSPIDGSVSTMPTDCSDGLAGRWAMTPCPLGIAFVALDGVRVTRGAASEPLSDNIRGLFHGEIVNGYQPIDWSHPEALRLSYMDNEIRFVFQDVNGVRACWIYSLLYRAWRYAAFAVPVNLFYDEPSTSGPSIIVGGGMGKAYLHAGTDDDGVPIAANYRSGALQFGAAEEKLWGDVVVDAGMNGASLTLSAYLDDETTPLAPVVDADQGVGTNLARYHFEPFGTQPSESRSLSVDLTWTGQAAISPSIAAVGVSYAIQPSKTLARATTWELISPSGAWVQGCRLNLNTLGAAKTVLVEGLRDGVVFTLATLTLTAATRSTLWRSWSAQQVDAIRLRPTDGNIWMLYGCEWVTDPLPPLIAAWDTIGEYLGETYYTGLSIDGNTFGAAKSIDVYVDTVKITTITFTANGQQLIHFPFGSANESYGKVYRFIATDGNPGLLYKWIWHTIPAPNDIANWDLVFEDLDWTGEKYLTGVQLECDTHGLPKTLQVIADGAVIETLTVTTTERQIVELDFPGGPYTGAKVLRLHATDTNPGRLFGKPSWLYEKEPPNTAGFGVLNFEDAGWIGEKYVSGILVECNTFCGAKWMFVEIDGVVVETILLQTRQRMSVQVPFMNGPYPASRVLRLLRADANPGKLYNHQWLFDKEPVDNAVFGVQNWSTFDAIGDKWVKGTWLEADTHGAAKVVNVEIDGAIVETITVNHAGRLTRAYTWPQVRGRVLRLRATDANPGKLYSRQLIFDEEPFALTRYETQELTLGVDDWKVLLPWSTISIRSNADVTLTVTILGQAGQVVATDVYTLPSTAGAKVNQPTAFLGRKGYFYKFVFTGAQEFWLYREESVIYLQPLRGGAAQIARPFGNDAIDAPRGMVSAAGAADRSGGSLGAS